jgi:hypothetical protein
MRHAVEEVQDGELNLADFDLELQHVTQRRAARGVIQKQHRPLLHCQQVALGGK